MAKRCVNIDWLEVYALEDITQARDAEYFLQQGIFVMQRAYGTRVWSQMFTICDTHGDPMLEVRRAPISTVASGGFLAVNACHLRLVNRYCYHPNPVGLLREFIVNHGYTYKSIYRIDLCLDFERFDSGDDPQKFLARYLTRKYSKINQSEAAGRWKDLWDNRDLNSVSWGAWWSPIGTKLYNKTRELEEVKDKPYIKQAWYLSELVADPVSCLKERTDKETGEVSRYKPTIWRLEFSIRSKTKGWVKIELNGNRRQYYSIRNNLEMYDTKEKQLTMLDSLIKHYFHFKLVEPGKTKYECRDKVLFKFGQSETFYKVEHPASALPKSTELARLLKHLQKYKLTHTQQELQEAVNVLIDAVEQEDLKRHLSTPFNRAELIALQEAFRRSKGQQDNTVEEVKKFVYDLFSGLENGETIY